MSDKSRNPFVNQVVCFLNVIDKGNQEMIESRNPFVNQVVCFSF